MNLDKFTFGRTPAAQYLVRRLNELDSKPLQRAVGVRVSQFNTNVRDIENSYKVGYMSAKTAANLLRMLRVEATQLTLSNTDDKIVGQLMQNTIIGNIKHTARKITVIRKIENGNSSLAKLKTKGSKGREIYGCTEYTILGYPAGYAFGESEYDREIPDIADIEDDVTPELLMERSDRRCLRQGKPHMKS
jgi:hypothetical protein